MKFYELRLEDDLGSSTQDFAHWANDSAIAEMVAFRDRFNRENEDAENYLSVRATIVAVDLGASAFYVTNAPVDYDGFRTTTIAKLGFGLRLVEILDANYAWQEGRYRSGLFQVERFDPTSDENKLVAITERDADVVPA